MKLILISLPVFALIYGITHALIHWRASRYANRVIDEVLHPERPPAKPKDNRHPMAEFRVTLSADGVTCERPDGRVERVTWDDLRCVEMLNTPDGPYSPDAFWILHGVAAGCVIPWGATGDRELLERLQKLPHFDSKAIIDGATTTEYKRTVLWKKMG
ncbi:MAG: hypothetical protein K8R23_17505 [Chthoniobacter sp.]|nr:hypothetical protein [Chthoniobacter sp.]